MDVCIHRWIDRAIFTAPYPTPPRATRPSRAARGPSFSFLMPLSLPSRLHGGRGRGREVPGDRRGPSLLARDGFIRSLPFVSLFMKSREGGGTEGGGRGNGTDGD